MLKVKEGNTTEKFCEDLKPHPTAILYYKFLPVFCLYSVLLFCPWTGQTQGFALSCTTCSPCPLPLPQCVQCRKENHLHSFCFLGVTFPAHSLCFPWLFCSSPELADRKGLGTGSFLPPSTFQRALISLGM